MALEQSGVGSDVMLFDGFGGDVLQSIARAVGNMTFSGVVEITAVVRGTVTAGEVALDPHWACATADILSQLHTRTGGSAWCEWNADSGASAAPARYLLLHLPSSADVGEGTRRSLQVKAQESVDGVWLSHAAWVTLGSPALGQRVTLRRTVVTTAEKAPPTSLEDAASVTVAPVGDDVARTRSAKAWDQAMAHHFRRPRPVAVGDVVYVGVPTEAQAHHFAEPLQRRDGLNAEHPELSAPSAHRSQHFAAFVITAVEPRPRGVGPAKWTHTRRLVHGTTSLAIRGQFQLPDTTGPLHDGQWLDGTAGAESPWAGAATEALTRLFRPYRPLRPPGGASSLPGAASPCPSSLGVLLTGPRGSGKCRAVYAAARRLGLRVVERDYLALLGPTPQHTEQRLTALTKHAQACRPCVLFLRHMPTQAQERACAQGGVSSAAAGGGDSALEVMGRIHAMLRAVTVRGPRLRETPTASEPVPVSPAPSVVARLAQEASPGNQLTRFGGADSDSDSDTDSDEDEDAGDSASEGMQAPQQQQQQQGEEEQLPERVPEIFGGGPSRFALAAMAAALRETPARHAWLRNGGVAPVLLVGTAEAVDDLTGSLRDCFTHELDVGSLDSDTRAHTAARLAPSLGAATGKAEEGSDALTAEGVAARTAGRTPMELRAALGRASTVCIHRAFCGEEGEGEGGKGAVPGMAVSDPVALRLRTAGRKRGCGRHSGSPARGGATPGGEVDGVPADMVRRFLQRVGAVSPEASPTADGGSETAVAGKAGDVLGPDAARGVRITAEGLEQVLKVLQSGTRGGADAPKVPSVHWSDVGGLAYAKGEILDLVQLPLRRPDLYRRGLRSRSGILLYGPPGTGKTLMAKAVATECSLNFMSVKGPELLNMYVGESEKNIRETFAAARAAAPCVLFFDELDSLAPARGRGTDSGGVMDRIVSQLLTELDGMQQSNDLFIIGATNRPDLLEPALLRPGRFDRLIFLGVSQEREGQAKILRALTRRFLLAPDVDVDEVAGLCPPRCTGADFYALASTALGHAMKRRVQELEAFLGEERQHHPEAKGVSPQDLLEALPKHALRVPVSRADFLAATQELVPSVSEGDIARYEQLRQEFSGGATSGS